MLSKHFQNTSIYAFEPVKKTFEKLQNNTESIQSIKLINKGLFSKKCSKVKIVIFIDTE